MAVCFEHQFSWYVQIAQQVLRCPFDSMLVSFLCSSALSGLSQAERGSVQHTDNHVVIMKGSVVVRCHGRITFHS